MTNKKIMTKAMTKTKVFCEHRTTVETRDLSDMTNKKDNDNATLSKRLETINTLLTTISTFIVTF